MAKNNPTNPFTRDETRTQREMPSPVQKAKVISVEDHPDEGGYHTARVSIYGEPAEQNQLASVLAPHKGDVTVPERGDDVLLLFGPNDKPWIVGHWYARDREDEELDTLKIPNYTEGDRIIGNGTGSYVAIRDSGRIEVVTDRFQPVNIDHQSATVLMSSDQSVASNNVYYKLNFDTINSDPEELFDTTNNEFTVRNDGLHEVSTSVEIPTPKQGNRYQLALVRNGSEWKRTSAHSSTNEQLSIQVDTQARLDSGDTIDVRLRQNSGSTKTVSSDPITTEFSIQRRGI